MGEDTAPQAKFEFVDTLTLGFYPPCGVRLMEPPLVSCSSAGDCPVNMAICPARPATIKAAA